MRKIYLARNEEVAIYVDGKKMLGIDQVSDSDCLNCYLYSDYLLEDTASDLKGQKGFIGELLADHPNQKVTILDVSREGAQYVDSNK